MSARNKIMRGLVRSGVRPTNELMDLFEEDFTEAERDILFNSNEPSKQVLKDFVDNGICKLNSDRCTPTILGKLCVDYGISFGVGWREYQECWC